MKRKNKFMLLMLMVLSVLCLALGAVACKGETVSAEDAIKAYLLPQAETLVTEDFNLAKHIGKDNAVSVTWESSNTNAIAIEDGDENNYNAKVTIQETVTPVVLTIKSGEFSKDFNVRVDGLDVYSFLDRFKFEQNGSAVKEDFDLPTTMTYAGKEATITWTIDADSAAVAVLNEAGNKVLVTPGEDLITVKITAKFTYGGENAEETYTFSVSPSLDHLQIVNRIYSVEGYPVDVSGYILHLGEASASYGNATFFLIDDDFCSGYYFYRVGINKEEADKFADGVHVTVTGGKATCYSGLWETAQKSGTATVDDKEPINPRDHIYAADTDLLSGAPSAIWHQSMLVSLSGWKVVDKAAEKPDSDSEDQTLFKLERGDTKIPVWVSKYVTRTDAELAALYNVYDSVSNGQFVNVTGILGNHDGVQIQPILASDIVKVNAEGTDENAAKVKAAVAAVDAKIEENFASLILSAKDVTMPTDEGGVAISYKLAGDPKNPTVTIDGGTISIKPNETLKNYDVQVTYSIGSYKAYEFFKIKNQVADATTIVGEVIDKIKGEKFADFNGPGQISLPSLSDDELMGATLTWTVDSTTELDWIKIEKGKLTVAPLPAETTQVTLKATADLDGTQATATFKFTVHVGGFNALTAAPAATGDFYLAAMHYGRRMFVTGTELDGGETGYFTTTDNLTLAAKLTLEKSDNNWLIKFNGKYVEVNPYKNSSGKASYNLRLVATATANAVWEWDADLKIFKQKPVSNTEGVTAANAYYYIGMRDSATFLTMSPSAITFITGNNASNLDTVQHPAYFGTNPFTALTAAAAGTYKFAMYNATLGATYYLLGTLQSGYLQSTEKPSEAVDYTIALIEGTTDHYTISVGGKYVEFEPRTGTSAGVNTVLKESPTAGKYWQWNDGIKNFVFESTYNDQEDATKTDLYYLGTYSTHNTASGNYISRIADKSGNAYVLKENVEGVSQWVAHFGTIA